MVAGGGRLLHADMIWVVGYVRPCVIAGLDVVVHRIARGWPSHGRRCLACVVESAWLKGLVAPLGWQLEPGMLHTNYWDCCALAFYLQDHQEGV
jgi:hypothetical protein